MKPYWVSWFGTKGTFELEAPWWISGWEQAFTEEGELDEIPIFCAAVMARSEDEARAHVMVAHEGPGPTRWRFVTEKPAGWEPFGERFPRDDWMKWPWPQKED